MTFSTPFAQVTPVSIVEVFNKLVNTRGEANGELSNNF